MFLQVGQAVVLRLFFSIAQLAISLGNPAKDFDPVGVPKGKRVLPDGQGLLAKCQLLVEISQLAPSIAHVVVTDGQIKVVGGKDLFPDGKGFLKGTQSHLNFLPEKHTDFIYTMLSEEFGMVGAVLIILINLIIIAYGFSFAFKSSSYFGKILALGLTTNYFLYVFINTAMVLGLIPVVGVPLPLISYGGTVMLSIMASFGLMLSVYINRNISLGKE